MTLSRHLDDIRQNLPHVGCSNDLALEMCAEIESLRAERDAAQADATLQKARADTATETLSRFGISPPDMVDASHYQKPEHGWTCWFCGETFHTPFQARQHFGAAPLDQAGCQIKVGDERQLLGALRDVQAELATARAALTHQEGATTVCISCGHQGGAPAAPYLSCCPERRTFDLAAPVVAYIDYLKTTISEVSSEKLKATDELCRLRARSAQPELSQAVRDVLAESERISPSLKWWSVAKWALEAMTHAIHGDPDARRRNLVLAAADAIASLRALDLEEAAADDVPKIRCGDHVLHEPSGEAWVVAFADYETGDLAWCGWPEGTARIDECRLIKPADDPKHFQHVRDVIRSGGMRGDKVERLYGAALEAFDREAGQQVAP